MTIRELAVELGVAAAYLEDEIGLIEKYHLIRALSGVKYQTNLVVFTNDYQNEFNRTVEESLTEDVGAILLSMWEKLPKLRELGFIGFALEKNRLLWALLFVGMRKAVEHLETGCKDEIYRGAAGTNYGTEYDVNVENDPYGHRSSQLSVGARWNRWCIFCGKKPKILVRFMIICTNMPSELCGSMHRRTFSRWLTMSWQTCFFETVGMMGFCAVKSGELTIPEDDLPAAVLIVRE